MTKSRILVVFGTRPEVIKIAPVIRAMQASETVAPVTCVTAQHRELLDQMLQVFGIAPDHDLNLMTERQGLAPLTSRALEGVSAVIKAVAPEYVMVQGDTTTALASAMAAFYERIPVAHVEAGLRTGRRCDPYPEEMSRVLIGRLADIHYAPTSSARDNLIREGVAPNAVLVTGNTVVDALRWMLELPAGGDYAELASAGIDWNNDLPILVTAHRRENWGALPQLCEAIRRVAALDRRIQVVFPIHPNPVVSDTVRRELRGSSRVHLLGPLPYTGFVHLMARCSLVLTDSGGVQEEVASLGKRVVVMRTTTERPEILSSGYGVLAGTDPLAIEHAVAAMLGPASEPPQHNPFGDGYAAARIVRHLESLLLPGRKACAAVATTFGEAVSLPG